MFLQRLKGWLPSFLGHDSNQNPDKLEASALAGEVEQMESSSPLTDAEIVARQNPEANPTENLRPSTNTSTSYALKQVSSKKNDGAKPIDLIVGLDFGTAATKVIIRSPYLPGERARAISFGDLGHHSSGYLLPTRITLRGDGRLTLPGTAAGKSLTNLKTALMDRGDEDSVINAAAFLGLVLRQAKEKFLVDERDTYRRFEPRWAVNIGIPSAGYDELVVRERFLHAARLAWKLSEENRPLTLPTVTEALADLRESGGDVESRIAVIPEVVAQAIGYARSPLRDPGLHLLIDIGASTLDICGFFLRSADGQDNYDLLTATVDRLGVMELHRRRVSTLRCEDKVQKFRSFDALSVLPDTLTDYHPGCCCGAQDTDGEFLHKVIWIIVRHLAALKKLRDPNSDRWRTGLPLFFCGGGSAVKLFRYAAAIADQEFRKVMIAAPVHLRPLPKPSTLTNRDFGDNFYHRLSVAYGLSFEAFNLGSISGPSELEDIIPEKGNWDYDKWYVSKEQV